MPDSEVGFFGVYLRRKSEMAGASLGSFFTEEKLVRVSGV